MGIKKILVNSNEQITDSILCSVMPKNKYRVCPKIRLADVIHVDEKSLGKKLSYALKAHFDFTIINKDDIPQFSVEFDGRSHNGPASKKRDQFKNAICLENNYPLIRINEYFVKEHFSSSIGKFTLLSWLVEVWRLAQAFFEEQRKGNIPEEEDFDYWAFMELTPDFKKITFPYNPFLECKTYFHKMFSEKRILWGPQGVDYEDADGFARCFMVVAIDHFKALTQSFGVVSFADFPICDFELCENMCFLLIYKNFIEYQKGGRVKIRPLDEACNKFDELITKYKYDCRSFGQNLPANFIE